MMSMLGVLGILAGRVGDLHHQFRVLVVGEDEIAAEAPARAIIPVGLGHGPAFGFQALQQPGGLGHQTAQFGEAPGGHVAFGLLVAALILPGCRRLRQRLPLPEITRWRRGVGAGAGSEDGTTLAWTGRALASGFNPKMNKDCPPVPGRVCFQKV